MNHLKRIFSALFNLIVPNLCVACGKNLESGEKFLCTHCLAHLPLEHCAQSGCNSIEKKFIEEKHISHAMSYLIFENGNRAQAIVHDIKYHHNTELGIIMGRRIGLEIAHMPQYSGINYIIPVPLHRKRYKKRGYNQSELLCKGIAEILGTPIDKQSLLRTKNTSTQTKKNRAERENNMEGVFTLKDSGKFANKTILLVDDVITTGATLKSCAKEFKDIPGIKILIASLANRE